MYVFRALGVGVLFHEIVDFLNDRGGRFVVFADDQKRIVACNRAYDLGIVELIDHGARVGAVPRKRLDDDHILRAFQGDHAIAEQIFHFGGNFPLAVVYIRIAVFLFNPRNFEQMQIFDISRNGRLRHDVIELIQIGTQLLLRFDLFLGNNLQNFCMSGRS